MTVNTLTLYLPGSSIGIQVYEGSQLHLILVSQGANSVPSAPGETVRQDPYPQYVDAEELAAALAGVGAGGTAYTDEQVRDVVAAMLVEGANVTLTKDDANDSILVSATGGGGTAPTYANLPAGSTLTVLKSGTWPARPTSRTDITVAWKGADPSPAIGGTGMVDGVDYRLVTP